METSINLWEKEKAAFAKGERIEYRERKECVWSLPEPPSGQAWHRVDGWTKEMLPEGWRPLLKGERIEAEDQFGFLAENGITWETPYDSIGRTSDYIDQAHVRTKRPLSTPERVALEPYHRAEFEAWAKGYFVGCGAFAWDDGIKQYDNLNVAHAFFAWCAAIDASKPA